MKKQVKILSLIFSACLCMTAAAPALSVYGEEPSVEEILADNNIPVVYISIDENAEGYCTIEEMNSSPDHSSECTGTVQIDVPEDYKGDYSDEILADTGELQLEYIRGRGHTTWSNDKKPMSSSWTKKPISWAWARTSTGRCWQTPLTKPCSETSLLTIWVSSWVLPIRRSHYPLTW